MPSDRGFYHSSTFIDSRRFSAKRVLCASWPAVHEVNVESAAGTVRLRCQPGARFGANPPQVPPTTIFGTSREG